MNVSKCTSQVFGNKSHTNHENANKNYSFDEDDELENIFLYFFASAFCVSSTSLFGAEQARSKDEINQLLRMHGDSTSSPPLICLLRLQHPVSARALD